MSSEFDYDIKVGELIPPIGELKYYAKVSFLVEYAPPAAPRQLTPPGFEYHGVDKSTASAKARAAMEAWIDARKNP